MEVSTVIRKDNKIVNFFNKTVKGNLSMTEQKLILLNMLRASNKSVSANTAESIEYTNLCSRNERKSTVSEDTLEESLHFFLTYSSC